MEALRQWAFGICAAAIACGLIQLVLPQSGMQKVFRVTAGVFFLGCILSPLVLPVAGDLDFTVQKEQMQAEVERRSGQLRMEVTESGNEIAVESVRREAARALEEIGIPYQKIYVNIHDMEDGGISISECEVELERRYAQRHDEIRQYLMGRLGVNVLIGYTPSL